jgi:hypothetical protein
MISVNTSAIALKYLTLDILNKYKTNPKTKLANKVMMDTKMVLKKPLMSRF